MGFAPEYHGSLVAFEGSQDLVSTQMQLLPSSSRILVIPPLQHFLAGEDVEKSPDARTYILKIHDACNARAHMAHRFLEDSSPENKRLVFMDGGTAEAQLRCIKWISLHHTNGNIPRAEAMFKALARNGVAGLTRKSKQDATFGDNHGSRDDPVSQAMRAADTLDFLTASLQPSNEIDLTLTIPQVRPRSMSVPVLQFPNDFQEAVPFYVFGPSTGEPMPENPTMQKGRIPKLMSLHKIHSPGRRSKSRDRSAFRERAARWAKSPEASMGVPPLSPGTMSMGKSSQHTKASGSMPNSPSVVYGEAYMVHMRATSKEFGPRTLRRGKSCDSLRHGSKSPSRNFSRSFAAKSVDALYCYESRLPLPKTSARHRSRSNGGTEQLQRSFSGRSRSTSRKPPPLPLDLTNILVNDRKVAYANKHTNALDNGRYADKATSPENCYVDHGTWTGHQHQDHRVSGGLLTPRTAEAAIMASKALPEIVLPMVEDLVIHFIDDNPIPLLDSILSGFRRGVYPISMEPEPLKSPAAVSDRVTLGPRQSTPPLESDINGPTNKVQSDDYDPFASDVYQQVKEPDKAIICRHTEKDTSPTRIDPPTPARTPPIDETRQAPKITFHDFRSSGLRTAICVQNALRSVLETYFSPDDAGYHQFTFPLLPGSGSLWEPLFGKPGINDPIQEDRQVDLILAVGAQRGVPKDFISVVCGSLDKLGVKPTGVSRSGRLDLRYLVANAMQSFTSQPLTNQTENNPFGNPLRLATLLVPHLENYITAHPQTRFLTLEYAPEHLSTVLCLQRLIGADLFKIAAILSPDPPKTKRGHSKPGHLTGRTFGSGSSIMSRTSSIKSIVASSPSSGSQSPGADAFSKANFVLTSQVSESEIALFVSMVLSVLISKSSFYVPERPPPTLTHRESKTSLVERPRSPPMPSPDYTFLISRVSAQTQNLQGTDPPALPVLPHLSSLFDTHYQSKPQSPVDIPVDELRPMSSPKSIRSIRSRKSAKVQKLMGHSVKPSVDSRFDAWDEEDAAFWAEERKYMPFFLDPSARKKTSSRKALKWLGLA
ncbi:hypothetical protein PG993_008165 [Apiospora rasikravindrae]|uniref:Gastric mucin-like protein n=1 Tax=Apiospora rasikravindrae TaxID=990691 RepID=A0ABR1T1E5_9PEZI